MKSSCSVAFKQGRIFSHLPAERIEHFSSGPTLTWLESSPLWEGDDNSPTGFWIFFITSIPFCSLEPRFAWILSEARPVTLDAPVNAAEIGFPMPGMNLAALEATDSAVETTSRPNFAILAPVVFANLATFFAAMLLCQYLICSEVLSTYRSWHPPLPSWQLEEWALWSRARLPLTCLNTGAYFFETFLNAFSNFLCGDFNTCNPDV